MVERSPHDLQDLWLEPRPSQAAIHSLGVSYTLALVSIDFKEIPYNHIIQVVPLSHVLLFSHVLVNGAGPFNWTLE